MCSWSVTVRPTKSLIQFESGCSSHILALQKPTRWRYLSIYRKFENTDSTIISRFTLVYKHTKKRIMGKIFENWDIARNHGHFCSWICISQIASCMTSANKRWTIFGRRWSMNADENSYQFFLNNISSVLIT
jgi:hypothetical protein